MKQIAIITGVSRANSIGAAICHKLARDGIDIFFTHLAAADPYVTSHHYPRQLKQELLELGVRAAEIEVDFTDEDAPARLMQEVRHQLGEPTILVNNATYEFPSNAATLSGDMLDRHYQVNNKATILLSTLFASNFQQVFPEGRQGRIIFMVSGGPDPNNLAYIATKGALKAITPPLATNLAASSITVNALDPGPTDTGWIEADLKQQFLPLFPAGRIGEPLDAANMISLIVREEASWLTGQVIAANGGFLGK
ncbi:SDR family oxidoreductase [Gracilibacillus alcaliphilus]|uniref:SDR family oxidoreductase n=1 Tax=Gracilibacillus alcaliphilus TaxID=1401441 RepID=UPI001956E26B|nr:SDR family oxidoreductase [Gracilibacillus alcaliphilus]MBM7676330.1 3-oxoacyl-[acyl-carrier protein] reductase [Gracilibacillus alcaliphilus]